LFSRNAAGVRGRVPTGHGALAFGKRLNAIDQILHQPIHLPIIGDDDVRPRPH
jgi:hypothetical protein